MNFDNDVEDEYPVRSSTRERRRPAYLSDYVDMDGELDELVTTMSEVSCASSAISSLSHRQTVELERSKRRNELDEMKRQLEEERRLAVKIQHIQDKRRELQILERGIVEENEEMMKQRRLRQAEQRYIDAELVADMVKAEECDVQDVDKKPSVSRSNLNANAFVSNRYDTSYATPSTAMHTTPSTAMHTTPSTAMHATPSTAMYTTPSTAMHTTPSSVQRSSVKDIPSTNIPMNAMLVSSVYGIPKPTLPKFKSGNEKDFLLLKMALENLVDVHSHLSETYKYQLLLDNLGNKPKQLAESFMFHPTPYTVAVQELDRTYGSPGQLVQSEISSLLNMPPIKLFDNSLENFQLRVQSLVGMLKSIGSVSELKCASHVSNLISKLPHGMRDSFIEYCLKRGLYDSHSNATYNLIHFDQWLQLKSRTKRLSRQAAPVSDVNRVSEKRNPRRSTTPSVPSKETGSASAFYTEHQTSTSPSVNVKVRTKGYCPMCSSSDHFLNSCPEFKKLSEADLVSWLKDRCFKCARKHMTENCTLKTPCHICKDTHLTVLHNVQRKFSPLSTKVLLDQPSKPFWTMLKIVEVILHGPDTNLKAYAILDDGSQRSMMLDSAVTRLHLPCKPDTILLTTIRRDSFWCSGQSVDLQISTSDNPTVKYDIVNAFTSTNLSLSEYTYPVSALQKKWPHLKDIPLPPIDNVKPVVLIGSDFAELIVPREPVRTGPRGSPMAVHTRLGWSLQGAHNVKQDVESQSVLLTAVESASLVHDVQKLCDRGTNFKGGQRELNESWAAMAPSLCKQLANVKIDFRFNPPSAPHFGGTWEREIRCVKDGLKVTLGDQSVTEPVLLTVLAEIEAILNSKPLGYVSSDVRDIDPITPNVLLMGRRDPSLPQVIYPESDIIGRRRWRHSQILSDHFWTTVFQLVVIILNDKSCHNMTRIQPNWMFTILR